MRFARRAVTGLYMPNHVSPLEYGLWDDFLTGNGPNGGILNWIGLGTTPDAFTTNGPFNRSKGVCTNFLDYVARQSGVVGMWASASSSIDTIFLTDQYSQITYEGNNPGHPLFGTFLQIGVCVRATGGSGGGAGYFGLLDVLNNKWRIGGFINGSGENNTVTGSISGATIGDIVKVSVTGLVVSLFQNNTLLGSKDFTGTTSVYNTGAPGVYWGGGDDGTANSTCELNKGRTFGSSWQGGTTAPGIPAFNDFRGSGYWFPEAQP